VALKSLILVLIGNHPADEKGERERLKQSKELRPGVYTSYGRSGTSSSRREIDRIKAAGLSQKSTKRLPSRKEEANKVSDGKTGFLSRAVKLRRYQRIEGKKEATR